jgi:TatA/E family protein of Tat protein translocase
VLNLGATELILVLILALVLFGPGKLPEVGRAIGRGIRDFRDALSGTGPEGPAGGLLPPSGTTQNADHR